MLEFISIPSKEVTNRYLRLAERAFVILSLSFFSGIFGLYSLGAILPNSLITSVRYFIWANSIVLLCIFWKSTLKLASYGFLLWILTGLILLSTTWSISPNITAFNMKEIWMMTLFGLYFATRFSIKEQVELVSTTLLCTGILSAIFAMGFPAIGKHAGDHPGAWKGIYGYKNNLGSIMLLSSLAFWSLPKEYSSLYRWGGFIFSLLLMLLSTSKTSVVVSFVVISIITFYRNYRWQGKKSIIWMSITILLMGCMSILVINYLLEILAGLGRDITFTGRTPLWNRVISRLMEKPFFGYGRGAFWIPDNGYALEAGNAVSYGWIPPHSHNGFIDFALDVGLVGLFIFMIIFLTSFIRSLKLAYLTSQRENTWPLIYLIFLTMNNITESYLLRLENIYWVLFISITLFLNNPKKEEVALQNKD